MFVFSKTLSDICKIVFKTSYSNLINEEEVGIENLLQVNAKTKFLETQEDQLNISRPIIWAASTWPLLCLVLLPISGLPRQIDNLFPEIDFISFQVLFQHIAIDISYLNSILIEAMHLSNFTCFLFCLNRFKYTFPMQESKKIVFC